MTGARFLWSFFTTDLTILITLVTFLTQQKLPSQSNTKCIPLRNFITVVITSPFVTHLGWTPLMRLAMVKGNIHIARLLIHHGANVSSMDKDGKSVLMIASLNGQLDLVKLLIYKGADFTVLSGHGKSALDFARAFDREAVVGYLEELWQAFKAKERKRQMDNWQNDEKYSQTVHLLKSARSVANAEVTELSGHWQKCVLQWCVICKTKNICRFWQVLFILAGP